LLTTLGDDFDERGLITFPSAGDTSAALKALRRREMGARRTSKSLLNKK
jgi:hypothetical protein